MHGRPASCMRTCVPGPATSHAPGPSQKDGSGVLHATCTHDFALRSNATQSLHAPDHVAFTERQAFHSMLAGRQPHSWSTGAESVPSTRQREGNEKVASWQNPRPESACLPGWHTWKPKAQVPATKRVEPACRLLTCQVACRCGPRPMQIGARHRMWHRSPISMRPCRTAGPSISCRLTDPLPARACMDAALSI